MKKSTLAVLLALSTAGAQAQGGKWAIGIEGGPSLVSLRGNAFISDALDPAISFTGGLTVQRALGGRLYIRSGASLSQKGGRKKAEVFDNNGVSMGEGVLRARFTYLTVPVMAGLHLGSSRSYVFVQGGPWVGFLLQQRNTLKGANVNEENDNSAYYEKLDLGLAAGVGAFLPLNNRTGLSVELRDELGLANTSKVPVSGNDPLRTNALSLLLGIHFGL